MEEKWQIVLALAIVCCNLSNVQSVTFEDEFDKDLFKSPQNRHGSHKSASTSGEVIELRKYGSGYIIKEADTIAADGVVKIKYNEFYKGINVVGSSVVLERGPDGSFKDFAFGRLVKHIEDDLPSVKPKISVSRALKIAKSYERKVTSKSARSPPRSNHNKDTDAEELGRSVDRGKLPQKHSKPKTETLIYIDTERNNRAVLVYHIHYLIETKEFASKPSFLINAETGKVIKHWDGLGFSSYKMSANGGNEKIGKYRYGEGRWAARKLNVKKSGSYCHMKNARAKLINCNHNWNCPASTAAFKTSCSGPNDGDNGAYSQAADAFWFTTAVEDMYKIWYNDDTIFNRYGRFCVRVHYGYNYANAYWNGECITFGDGNPAGSFFPLTSADIVAHEMAHALVRATSNLWYWGQSGGINEAFSDMAGEAFKNYLRGTNDWNLAYDVMRKKDALRFIDYPPKDRISIQCARNYYGQNVHYTSGVYNKAFYILANKPAWSVKTAFAVFLRANKLYWNSVTNYNQGACGVRQAAIDLGHKHDDVDEAFAQVGVFCKCPLGFKQRNDWSCYKFVKDKASWSDSKVYCESIGAGLVAIEDKAEQKWIEKYIDNHKRDFFSGKKFWIGGIDIAKENTWKWVHTGKQVVYDKWLPGEPNNVKKTEHCMAMTKDDGHYGWYDQDCNRQQMYICEISC